MMMKNWKILSAVTMPVVAGLVLASCGGSGDGNPRIPGGRPSFQIGDFIVQSPANGASNICLQPDIEIVVPRNSGLCNRSAGLDRYIGIQRQNDFSSTELLPVVTFRNTGNSSTCVVRTRPRNVLSPLTEYYISVDKDGGGNFIFESGNASEFRTTSVSNNNSTACRNGFQLVPQTVSELDWRPTDILNTARIDNRGDLVFDGENVRDVVLDLLAAVGWGQLLGLTSGPIAYSPLRMQFNSNVDPIGLDGAVGVYRLALDGSGQNFTVFQRIPLGLCPTNPNREISTNRCIYVNPNRPDQVILVTPGMWAPGTYMVFVLDRLLSLSGQALRSSYVTTFVVQ